MFPKGQLALLQSFFAAALYDDQLNVVSVDVALFSFALSFNNNTFILLPQSAQDSTGP